MLSKVLERHVHNHLYDYLTENNLLYPCQSGFRKYHGTESALIRIIHQLLFNLDKNRVSGLVFIDYRKAFDMVDHEILIAKLSAYGVSDTTAKWFQSYLRDRKQFVSIGIQSSTHESPMEFRKEVYLVHYFLLFLSMTFRFTSSHPK